MVEVYKMGKTKIKICGLKRPEDIQMVNRLKPDFSGFVFAGSKRKVDKEQARKLREALDPDIPAVGVFVNETIQNVTELCREKIIQIVQLHGDEDAYYIEEIRKNLPDIPLIKAVRVQSKEQILEAEKLDVDYLLLDTYVKGQYGGSGTGFDKALIPKLTKPYFLAGGLDAENVNENISRYNPFAVDVSSAVETDGVKDETEIEEFIERVRNHE